MKKVRVKKITVFLKDKKGAIFFFCGKGIKKCLGNSILTFMVNVYYVYIIYFIGGANLFLEDYHVVVPICREKKQFIAIVNHDCYIGPVKTNGNGSFMCKSQVDCFPSTCLERFLIVLTEGLDYLKNKQTRKCLMGITNTISMQLSKSIVTLESSIIDISKQFDCPIKFCSFFKVIIKQMIYCLAIDEKKMILIDQLSTKLSRLDDHGSKLFEDWSLTNIRTYIPEEILLCSSQERQAWLCYIYGMKDILQLATDYQHLFSM